MSRVKIPNNMNAFVLTGHGGIDRLEYHTDWPVPQPGHDDVLIKVHACGLNNTDVNTRLAWYSKTDGGANADASWGGAPISFPRIQGADVCGSVVAIGENAPKALLGKRVLIDTWLRDWTDPENKNKAGYYGSECDGGFAEYTLAHHKNVHPVNSKLSHAQLATFATSWMTAEGMLNRAEVKNGDYVLITGASAGVGSALITLANLRGAVTVAMTSAAKIEQITALDPAKIIDRNFNLANIEVDVVCDVVAGDMFPSLIGALRRGGRYVTSGAIAGAEVPLDVRTLYLNDLSLLGSTVVPARTFDTIVKYIESEKIRPILAESYKLRDLHAAQRAFIEKSHIGNIVVTMDHSLW